MTSSIRLQHVYSPDHYLRAVNVWKRLIDNHLTSIAHDERGYSRYADRIEDEHLYALIVSDGEETDGYGPVTLTLAEYCDYGGSCVDAANVKSFDGEFGWVSTSTNGVHGSGSAWVQLGELPDIDDIDNGLAMLEMLADTMDGLTDYPLISDEAHSEYVNELAEEAWDQFLGWDVRSELAELLGCDEYHLDDFQFSEDEIRELYYSFEDNEWNCETATSVVNGRHDEAVQAIADHIISEWRKPWVDPNQLTLTDA
ncbi:hypothetical protein [Amycolatopsis cihanbeyliensis]|uniref:Uncharacterized protein n=1 Tax=Amycolatopsis cihanbeyliensis TaxID=1128664 RepID=A0A542DNJ3_AMYCI|nr:hypothetical protein [Amycolatopsis cihanbeyliensis]TQJ04679.1 hypothetical protein FB471_4484 [Amycolatopsis cihanbeyliensis]